MSLQLSETPAPLPDSVTAAPAELQRIVSKALRKDREERYQSSKELLLDLKSLKQELEIEARLKGQSPPETVAPTASLPADQTATVEPPQTTSSASIIFSEIKRHKRGVTLTLAALLVIAGGLVQLG